MPSELLKLKNLGRVSARWLEEVGIHTADDLAAVGSVAAYRRVKERYPQASLNLLYALEGALEDIRWDGLPEPIKERLRAAVEL